ncbi:hypothetical protein GKZ68_03235 [Hymenobacter sp. BRD128]|uniref:hypothetical protein n=1 Tax=Hymenobacter sp. BRD128 TaxID=2675878 RepID=UPI001564865F|nr:hypothetical protein [Hymenobacter sp. BRD128]QKG55740.1 hypothetical protein GKZ68_03235 [Hymenobacter sp. BRD128]
MTAVPTSSLLHAEADFLELRYRPDVHYLVARWHRPVSGAELRQGYYAILRLAREVNCTCWKIDLRSRNAPDEADRRWVTAEFLTRAAQRLDSPVCLGYLLTPSLLGQMAPLAMVPTEWLFSPKKVHSRPGSCSANAR